MLPSQNPTYMRRVAMDRHYPDSIEERLVLEDEWHLAMQHAPSFGIFMVGLGHEVGHLLPWGLIGLEAPEREVSAFVLWSSCCKNISKPTHAIPFNIVFSRLCYPEVRGHCHWSTTPYCKKMLLHANCPALIVQTACLTQPDVCLAALLLSLTNQLCMPSSSCKS